MLYTFCKVVFLFIFYSVVGYITEVLVCWHDYKTFSLKRGYLLGPWIPIFGCGFYLLSTLTIYENHPEVVFIMGLVLSSILEYITSYVMEKLFKTRWWDYSDMKFNINGRVALRNSLGFGIVGWLTVYIFRPFNYWMFQTIPKKLFIIASLILFVMFVLDSIISTRVIIKVARTDELLKKKDMTSEIKQRVRGELKENYVLVDKILNTFPKAFKNVRKIFKTIRIKRYIK